MFDSILTSGVTPINFFICIGVAFVLGVIVALVHKKTIIFRRADNLCRFAAGNGVCVIVNGNLGAGVATVGIFSLVRFRSIPGNSRSILSVFFAMAIGLAVGTGYVMFAAFFTVIVSAIVAFLKFINFGESKAQSKILTILVPEDLDYTEMFDDIFGKYTKKHLLKKSKTTNMGSLFELTYDIETKPKINEKEFIDKIRVKNGKIHSVEEQEKPLSADEVEW